MSPRSGRGRNSGARVMLRDQYGPSGWEIDVPGAHMVRPLVPDDPNAPYTARVTHGETVRVLWQAGHDPTQEVVEVSVGWPDDPHWYQLRLPADALDAFIGLLSEARDARYRRAEDVALGRRRELPVECPW